MFREDYSFERQTVLGVLPISPDKSHKGLTRKEIVDKTRISSNVVSICLQTLKAQGEVKCNRLRWRRTEVTVKKIISSINPKVKRFHR